MINKKFEFTPISANHASGRFENVEFLPAVISLMEKYRHFLTDDFYPASKACRFRAYVDLINELYPHFYLILQNKESSNSADLVGFVYLCDWKGNQERVYSAHLTCCFDKKYWGEKTLECAKEFISMINGKFGLRKIKAQVFEHNFRIKKLLKTIGFKFEGVCINETLLKGKAINVINYGLLLD